MNWAIPCDNAGCNNRGRTNEWLEINIPYFDEASFDGGTLRLCADCKTDEVVTIHVMTSIENYEFTSVQFKLAEYCETRNHNVS